MLSEIRVAKCNVVITVYEKHRIKPSSYNICSNKTFSLYKKINYIFKVCHALSDLS